MKLKGAKAVHYDSGPNMTPLVDVVMVILIFLMLAGSFGGTTHYLMSKAGIKPKGVSHQALPPGYVPDIDLDLQISNNPDGPGFVARINNSPTGTGDEATLAATLSAKYKNFLAAGEKPEHLEVVLYPARNVKYEYVVQVYQAALQAQFQKVAFATSG
ncbi:MAG TPA: biopolymer transporter ExbD [Tepidisphaeraceae bacterium]|jgi:biopolymer transport protein ExbD|nr:biopolymer transporter ExbD [Tepidisphaeraceae bacterium]